MNGSRAGPVLAVLTVVRNDRAGLKATEDSLERQTHRNFEWIVADGGSVDGTAEWLAMEPASVARWVSAPDRGIYHAMNRALELATAPAVLFLNAGDTLASPDITARIAATLDDDPEVDFLYGDAWQRRDDGSVWLKRARPHRTAAYGMFTNHQAMVYRLPANVQPRFDERFRVGADYAFTLSALAGARRVRRLDVPVCVFGPPGLSHRRAREGRRDQARIRRELLGHGPIRAGLVTLVQSAAQLVYDRFPKTYAVMRGSNPERSFLSF